MRNMSGLHRALKTPFVCLQRFCILSQENISMFYHICLEQEKERFIWINNGINICWLVPSTVLSTLHLLNALVLTITLYNTYDYPHFMVKETWDTERLLLAPGHTGVCTLTSAKWTNALFADNSVQVAFSSTEIGMNLPANVYNPWRVFPSSP